MNLIKLNHIKKRYHTPTQEILALNDISFSIKKGEILGIIGPSGCGKSTLLNILTKLEEPSEGECTSSCELVIGYMMQNDALLPWLTVYDNALLGLKLQNKLTTDSIEYVNSLLKKYDLDAFTKEYPSHLSGGMRQRLALIRTLAIKPNILLLDEPFSKLDIDSRITISDDVYSIIKELGITTVLISHDIGEAITLCDEIVCLTKRPGKIKAKYEINFNEEIPSKRRNTEYFNEMYHQLWSEIDHV